MMKTSALFRFATPTLAWIVAGGCTPADSSSDTPTDDETAEPSLTYYRDVQPILSEHCGACHVEGGAAPFELTTHEQVAELAMVVRPAIESGEMPPWSADPECRTFAHERRLSDDEKAIVSSWFDAGMPAGDPADALPFEPPNLNLEPSEVSVQTWSAEPYTPDASEPDDYHCLVLDVEFTDPTYLSAYQVVPDPSGFVHHIIFYHVPPSGAAMLLEADAATPEPGYACFGASGFGGQPMGVWAPGGLPLRFPDASAYVIAPGSKIVAQMHYNTTLGPPSVDQTALRLAYLDAAPQLRVTMPILNGFFDIPAGDPAYAAEFEYVVEGDTPKQIVAVMPHMHLLGRTIDLRRARGNEETCIARIDDWDFHWQQFYDLRPDDFVEVQPGDLLRYRCEFDNSAENQPFVDGQQLPPGPVSFGEGTLDEMCLNVVAMIEPFVEAPTGAPCEHVPACYASSCTPEDGACFIGCGVLESSECGGCMLQGLGACAPSFCPSEADAVLTCLATQCDVDLNDAVGIQACLADTCKLAFDAEWACLQPHVVAGDCNAAFGACGFEY